jgi:small multidrug resistance pump
MEEISMPWVILGIAILFEVSGTTMMKQSHSFTRLVPSLLMFLFYGIGFALMTVALKRIDISVAYAIWSGVGTALIATIGFLWFREPVTPAKVVAIGLIITGVVLLNLKHGFH